MVSGLSRAPWVVALACAGACSVYDADRIQQSGIGAGGASGAQGFGDGGQTLPPAQNCRPNPDTSNTVCTEICPELCNDHDDDCDGRADESPADLYCATEQTQSVCLVGQCHIVECLGGARDCDLNTTNGCEVRSDDADNCGGCGRTCEVENGGATCVDDACAVAFCDSGYGDCDEDPAACETRTNTLTDCGGCRVACTNVPNATPSCETGSCGIGRCAAGFGDCDGRADNGCETELDTLANCGGCGRACNKMGCSGGICTSADCREVPGFADCDGDEVDCETNLTADLDHCGRCGAKCELAPGVTPHGTLGCSERGCTLTCDPGFGDCDGDYRTGCEQPLDALAHCGACGNVCIVLNASEMCVEGSCRLRACNPTFADCDGDGLTCETAINTPDNCGTCGTRCNLPHATASCADRSCAIAACEDGWADCDGVAANGCERNARDPSTGGAGPCLPDLGCELLRAEGHEYYFCPTRRSWSEARTRCRLQRNGDLLQIADAAENDLIRARLRAAAWTGLNDRTNEGLWIWESNKVPIWQGSPIEGRYVNWANGEPDGSGDCGQIYTAGTTDDLDCNTTLPFVCEVSPDACPSDGNKIDPGQCGCGMADTDADSDGFAACKDACPNDRNKRAPGVCGCGNADGDRDGDGAADCVDECDDDPAKEDAGACGCGQPDTDSDRDGTPDCNDGCPNDPATTSQCFPYEPNNFNPGSLAFGNAPSATLDCGVTTIDTSPTPARIENWCGGSAPVPVLAEQGGGPELVVFALRGLTVAQSATLRLVGERPVVFAVLGDVTVAGTIDASANRNVPGAGGNWSCGNSAGGNGNGDNSSGGGGGGGGGFGTSGGHGGEGDSSDRGGGGAARGNDAVAPLFGGCPGGRGGGCGNARPGAGGGAVQISATGSVTVSGNMRANGGEGEEGCGSEGGGSGGGSGGALLIEGVAIHVTGGLAANGGRGGQSDGNGGQGSTSANNSGGNGENSGANGGGGGGGGYGRIRRLDR